MSRKDRNNLLNKFQDETLNSLRDRLKELQQKVKTTEDSNEKAILDKQIKELRQFETYLIADIQVLKDFDSISSKDVLEVFNSCIEDAKKLSDSLLSDRTNLVCVKDTLKDIANFCIKLITFGYSQQFFDTTSKPIDIVQRDSAQIKQALENYCENISSISPPEP